MHAWPDPARRSVTAATRSCRHGSRGRLGLPDAPAESLVHRLEPVAGGPVQHPPERPDQQTAERLALDETGPGVGGEKLEAMPAVEESGNHEVTEPFEMGGPGDGGHPG